MSMSLWEYFWTEADWLPPTPSGPPIGSLVLMGAGRVAAFAALIELILELLKW